MWAKPGTRSGLRIRGARGDPTVRRALVRFAVWLRKNYEFPVRVPAYLSASERLTKTDGSLATAMFFAPFAADGKPYIRVATGDYPSERAARGRDDALASYLSSLAHEVIHYHQWVQTGSTSERGVPARACKMVHRYAETTARP